MSLGDVLIKIFYGCYYYNIITVTLKYSFSVPPGNKNNQAYPISRKFPRDVQRTSSLRPKVMSAY